MEQTKKRELLPDVLRGFAIIMVVLGHCIQEGSGVEFKQNTIYFFNKGYQFIYSFHMPLFMMISGYFAWDSIAGMQKSEEKWKLLSKRSATLLIPVLGWTCLDYVRLFMEHGVQLPVFQSLYSFMENFLLSVLTNAWFLWAVFWCFLIVFFMHCFFKDSLVLYAVGFLILFVIPDGLGLGAYKYMMPYFIGAFYFRGWQKGGLEGVRKNSKYVDRIKESKDWFWLAVVGFAFGVLFLLFDENSFIYLSGYKLIGKDVVRQLGIDFYRMIIGFVGAGFFILLWRKLLKCIPKYRFPVLSALGKNSLGIYMVSGYLILEAGNAFSMYFKPNYLLNLLQAAIVMSIAYLITIILRQIPVIKWLVGR